MTIIIETPQPPTRERLMRVPEGAVVSTIRETSGGLRTVLRVTPGTEVHDAEPADLERAGWVRDSDLLALTVRAEAAEAERDEARDTIARARGCITDVPAGVRNALDIEVARLLRERDEARAALATWQGSAEQERARIVADLRHDAEHLAWPIGTSPSEVLRGAADCIDAGWVRSEHAGTPAPASLPRATDDELVGVYLGAFRSSGPGDVETARRDGIAAVAARVRAEREPRDMPRATDEELFALAHHAMELRQGVTGAALAVAARVRREQCLVTRAVEANVDIRVCEDDGGGFMVGVHAPGDDEDLERHVPAADVPATLARLLGEVARG